MVIDGASQAKFIKAKRQQSAKVEQSTRQDIEMAVRRKRRKTAKRKTVKRRGLSAAVQRVLKRKAKNSRFTYGQLARVFRRGQGAYLSSGSRRGVSMQQWAYGRVNSFMRGGHSQDNDIKRKKRKTTTRRRRK